MGAVSGTCVIFLSEPEANLAEQAIRLMKEYGRVQAGTPSGDFSVIKLKDYRGWVVTCHHPDILNYVSPGGSEDELTIGIAGRAKRDWDAEELQIIHIENRK